MSAAFLLSAVLQFALALVVAALLGPAEFGLYALALSGGVLAQTLTLEWLRLSAARFHHPQAGAQLAHGLWRRTGWISLALLGTGALMALTLKGQARIFALVPVLAAVNGISDLALAMLRAEFETRRFARQLVARAVLAMLLVPLTAYATKSPALSLIALTLATLMPAMGALRALFAAPPAGEQPPQGAALLTYAGPIVLTNGLYLGFFFALRAGVAWFGGMAAAGHFSLALEFVLKLFSTIGTALDLALFPLALKAEREAGRAAAEEQTRTNLERVIAVLAPMMLGLMLVAPGLEPWLVAEAYRGPFARFVIAICPGIALYALVQYGLHPFAQLRHRTGVLVKAALAAFTLGALLALPAAHMPHPAGAVGLLLAGAMLAAGGVLARHAGAAAAPSVRFLVSLACCLALLGVVVTPLAVMGLNLPLLVVAVAGGALAYAGGAFALDLAGLRAFLAAR